MDRSFKIGEEREGVVKKVQTSLPTAIPVILVAGTKGLIRAVTHWRAC